MAFLGYKVEDGDVRGILSRLENRCRGGTP